MNRNGRGDRTWKFAARLAGLALACAAGAASQAGAASPAEEAADASLKARVMSALSGDEKARTLVVTVEVKGGVAILRGRVPHLAAGDNALHAAARVAGLIDVRNEIEIESQPGGDEALDTALAQALAREVRVVRVEAEVKAGVATLRGEVQDTTQRAAARNAALRLPGLRGVDNQIQVASEAGFDDARLQTRLVELIENRRLYPIQGDIRVRVVDRSVTLTGDVPRVFDRLIVEKVVGIVSGIRSVQNEVRVVPSRGSEVRQELQVPAR